MLEYFLYYLIIINILTFIIYGIDKEKAKKGQWRIYAISINSVHRQACY